MEQWGEFHLPHYKKIAVAITNKFYYFNPMKEFEFS